MDAFKSILARIAGGELPTSHQLLPYLCLESRGQRALVNEMLADACVQAGTHQHLEQARIFIQRAWLLSGGSADLMPLYSRIASGLNDALSMREAYKQLGMRAAARQDISAAIAHFTSSHYAHPLINSIDKYDYDFDIMRCMDQLAAPHRFHTTTRVKFPARGKIRLAHLVRGATELNSILVEINLVLARFYDKSRFEITFFIPESQPDLERSPNGSEYLRRFDSFGCQVVPGPDLDNRADALLEVARRINSFRPHLLVTSAALADYGHYFLTSLRPAPITIGLVQGPPPQFAAPILDWCIAWTKHPLMDTPVDCTWVDMKLDYPELEMDEPYERATLGLPRDACVLMSGGRYPKFQSVEFWKAIGELLTQHPQAYYVVAGPEESEIPALASALGPELSKRVRCLGWRKDFLRILPCADILIDTYPSGGGQVIVQAMSLGIPFVSHQNDYLGPFDQNNWSPVEDFISDAEIIVPRGDFERFKIVVSRLVEDTEYRASIGERVRTEHVSRADPSRAVRDCQEVYTKVLKRFSEDSAKS
jgi:glycosyltransferase involved in cell wall biosynthesis